MTASGCVIWPCLQHWLLHAGYGFGRTRVSGCAQGIGLADGEYALAARAIRAGLPCLQLADIAPPLPPDRSRGGTADFYDSFADVFTVLQVRWPHACTSRHASHCLVTLQC